MKFDVTIMARPQLKDDFLKEAFVVSKGGKKGTKIFYYDFIDADKVDELVEKESPKGRWLCYCAEEPGQNTAELLPDIVKTALFVKPGPSNLEPFAQCLKEEGAVFYGAFWCPHCQRTKAMFGSAAASLPYVECSTHKE